MLVITSGKIVGISMGAKIPMTAMVLLNKSCQMVNYESIQVLMKRASQILAMICQ